MHGCNQEDTSPPVWQPKACTAAGQLRELAAAQPSPALALTATCMSLLPAPAVLTTLWAHDPYPRASSWETIQATGASAPSTPFSRASTCICIALKVAAAMTACSYRYPDGRSSAGMEYCVPTPVHLWLACSGQGLVWCGAACRCQSAHSPAEPRGQAVLPPSPFAAAGTHALPGQSSAGAQTRSAASASLSLVVSQRVCVEAANGLPDQPGPADSQLC